VTFNATMGGWGQSTGTVWFDDLAVVGPDGENVLANGGFETTETPDTADAPANWETLPEWSGTAEFEYSSTVSRTGDNSIKISSSGGADASWSQTVSVEPNARYRLSGWIKTENLEAGSSHGAVINAHGLPESTAADVPATGTNDWMKMSTTVNIGSSGEVQFNTTLGGWGQATGTVWFDDVKLAQVGSGGSAQAVYDRVVTHVEMGGGIDDGGPDGDVLEANPLDWSTTNYSDTQVEFDYVSGASASGDRSVRISSTEGVDASWNQTVEVEPDTEYTLSGWIKTENVENLEDTGFVDITPVGAALNVDEVGGASDADVRTDGITGTTDWAEVSVTFNSGSNSELTVNGLLGGWGESTGTAWYDNLALEDPDGNNLLSNANFELGSSDAIDPSTTIQLGGETGGWVGQAPDSIADTTNPTLALQAGETYTVEWENLDGIGHNFEVLDADDPDADIVNGVSSSIMATEGETQTVEFEATEEMARYQCLPHAPAMNGDIEIVSGDN